MKFAQLLRMSIIAAVAAFSLNVAQAQSPNEQVGVGIGVNGGGSTIGGLVAYAISPAVHIGTQFGFQVRSANSISNTYLILAPYAKFIMKGTPQFKPFGMASFGLSSSPDGIGGSTTNTSFNIAVGAEYFLNKNFGIYGGFNFLGLGLGDNSFTTIGIGNSFLGVEWFFD